MNLVQLGIVVVIGVIILLLIGHFWYQEAKFKKIVESNFNHKVDDAISATQGLVMDGTSVTPHTSAKNVVEKDIINLFADKAPAKPNLDMPTSINENASDTLDESLAEDSYPDDSVEALFAEIKQIPFPFADEVSNSLDYVVNIVFEEPLKIKVLPDVASYTQKHYRIFILDSNNNWHIHEKTNKHNTLGLKVVVNLVDKNGIINQAQIENLYKELFKFTMQHQGFIEQSDYQRSIVKTSDQVKFLSQEKLELELFIVLKNLVDYTSLANFFALNGFKKNDGRFHYLEDNYTQYVITNEDNHDIAEGGSYNLLRIVAYLHFVPAPKLVVDNIFDFLERFMEKFESRVLTTNRAVFGEREYNGLIRHVNSYVNNAKKHEIELGGDLVRRLL